MSTSRFSIVGLLRRSTLQQGLLLLVVLVVSSVAVLGYRSADHRARATDDRLYDLQVLLSEVLSAETGLRGFVLLQQESALDPYVQAQPRIDRVARSLRQSLGERGAARLDTIVKAEDDWRSAFAEPVLAHLARGDRDAALALINTGQGKARVDGIREQVDELEALLADELEDERDAAELLGLAGALLAVAALSAIVVAAILSLLRLERAVAVPLVELASTADRFGAGDLTARVEPGGVREVERVAGAFNQMADRMQATVDDLVTVDRLKSEFVSVVSHELRTPLTSIRGSLGLLASGAMGDLPPDAAQMLNIAVSNTDRLVRLINDILDLERISAGHQALDVRRCEVADLLHDAAGNVAGVAEAARLTLEVIPVEATVNVDADRIVQALTNLLGNAVKFSRPGDRILLDAEIRGMEVVLRVRDQGRGVPPEMLERIFERFSQVDASDAREKGGTGLGLAIVRSIAERHGGRVEAVSEVGEGSTFAITLPLDRIGGVTPAPGSAGGAEMVLLVEDDGDLRDVVAGMLGARGIDVVAVSTAAQAIERCLSVHPDVLILDLALAEGSDGYEVVRSLRQHDELRNVPTIVYTVSDLTRQQRDALRLGETVFLSKGKGDPADLQDRVLSLLEKHRR